MICDICGQEVKNLGVHKYHRHSDANKPEPVVELQPTIKVDEIVEKPLSELISEIKNLLKPFRSEMDVRVSEKQNRVSEIELRVRIQK